MGSIQKFHDMLHLSEDIRRFGSPKNFDAGPLESSLRYWAKLFALTAQKRGYNTFVYQVSKRIHEQQALMKARRKHNVIGVGDEHLIQLDESGLPTNRSLPSRGGEPALKGSRFRIYQSRNKDGAFDDTIRYNKKMKKFDHSGMHTNIQEGVRAMGSEFGKTVPYDEAERKKYIDSLSREEVESAETPPAYALYNEKLGRDQIFHELYTECEMALPNDRDGYRISLRCHPNYQKEGMWYDWVVVDYDRDYSIHPKEDEQNAQYLDNCVPVKLLGFFKNEVTGQIQALVHPCEFRDQKDRGKQTVLTEAWRLSWKETSEKGLFMEDYNVINVSSIVAPCLAIQHVPGFSEKRSTKNDKQIQRDNKKVGSLDKAEKEYTLLERQSVTLIRPRRDWGRKFT